MRKTMLLALMLACCPALAEEWVSLGKIDNCNKETFADVSSIRIDSGIRRGSSKVVFASHVQAGLANTRANGLAISATNSHSVARTKWVGWRACLVILTTEPRIS